MKCTKCQINDATGYVKHVGWNVYFMCCKECSNEIATRLGGTEVEDASKDNEPEPTLFTA